MYSLLRKENPSCFVHTITLFTPSDMTFSFLFLKSVKVPEGVDVFPFRRDASTSISGGSRGIEMYPSKPGAPKEITEGGVVERKNNRNRTGSGWRGSDQMHLIIRGKYGGSAQKTPRAPPISSRPLRGGLILSCMRGRSIFFVCHGETSFHSVRG